MGRPKVNRQLAIWERWKKGNLRGLEDLNISLNLVFMFIVAYIPWKYMSLTRDTKIHYEASSLIFTIRIQTKTLGCWEFNIVHFCNLRKGKTPNLVREKYSKLNYFVLSDMKPNCWAYIFQILFHESRFLSSLVYT